MSVKPCTPVNTLSASTTNQTYHNRHNSAMPILTPHYKSVIKYVKYTINCEWSNNFTPILYTEITVTVSMAFIEVCYK